MRLIIKHDRFYRILVNANLLWAVYAPIILALVLNYVQVQGLFVLKDILFYFSFLLLILINRSNKLFIFLFKISVFVVYLTLLTGAFFELNSWIVYNFRQLLAPLLIVSFGYFVTIYKKSLFSIIRFFYKLGAITVLTGFLIKLLGLWQYINLANFFNTKGIPVDARGLSYMFYEPAFGYTERLVSTILDPISLGHILSAGTILCFYGVFIRGKKRWIYFTIFLLGLLFSFSKGAILQTILALFFFNKNLSYLVRFLIPGLFVAAVLLLINIDGILIHLVGLKNAIIYMNLFGHGLGLVGNYAKMFADNLTVYNTFKISDTFLGSVLGQIGLVGLLIWLSFFIRYSKDAILKKKTLVGSSIILSQLIVSALSENTLNFTSFIIPGIIGGLLVKNKI